MRSVVLAALCAAGLLAVAGQAAAVDIVSYDMTNMRLSGFGGWINTYSGTITPVSPGIANYSGGHGTLNDGFVPNDTNNNLLIDLTLNPTFTFFLDAATALNTIDVLGGGGGNAIPGHLGSADVTIGGVTETLSFSNIGGVNERLTLNTLAGTTASSFELSNITSSNGFPFQFQVSMAEVQANGQANPLNVIPIPTPVFPIPEPSSWALAILGFGLAGATLRSRRRIGAVAS